jgi:ABC-type uncharacterized transport system involved in gliding motility auxiliary subunit
MENTLTKHRLSGGAALLIFAGIVVAINVIFAGIRWRADLTEDRLYTLSEGTRALLKDLDRDVTLKFYASTSSEGMPIQLKQFAQRVEELLREYETDSGGRLVLETYDPTPDSDEEEWAQRYGVAGQATGMLGSGPAVYLGLVGVSGAREAVLAAISPNQEPQLEYQVTRLLYEVSRTGKAKIGVMSSLPVMGAPASPIGGGQGHTPAWIFVNELRRTYEVETVPPDVTAIPDGISTLLLMQPKDLSDETLFALDQFVLRGGRVLGLLDPLCVADVELSGQPLFQQRGGVESLNKLLGAWGLTLDTANVVADVKYATNLQGPSGAGTRNVDWLSLRRDAIKQGEVATTGLDNLLLIHAGHFTGEAAEGLTLTPLLHSSDRSGTVATMQAAMSADGGFAAMVPQNRELPLAVRLQGRFKTAFPEGKPTPADTEKADEPGSDSEALTESAGENAVILVADADLLYDRFAVRSTSFFGQTIHEPRNDNLSFVLNMVEQLTGSEALIGLRNRGTFNRPFTRVLDLERDAQERWRQEEQDLQAELQEAQARLNQLQQQKDPNQQYILSPQQQDEIKRFRKKQFETQKALKEVRKKLRRDVEQLGMTLKVINMGLMPLAVGLFGVFLGLRRRKV